MFRQMEKLIELLKEYEKVREKSEYQKLSNKEYKWFSSYFFPLCFWHKEDFSWAMTNEFGEWTEDVICSKKFWFIKWLVENEKIDFENRDLKDKYMEYFERYPYRPYTDFSLEWLIMLLSIQDNPIEFLVSILK
jgi:hypothetical protein